MDEMAAIRKKLRQALSQNLPDPIWESRLVQDAARDFLRAETDEDRAEEWRTLEDGARERLGYWNAGREERGEELSRGAQIGARSGSQDMEAAASRDLGPAKGVDAGEFVGERTEAMLGAMSALFVLIANQHPGVNAFREKVLPGRPLTAGEAHALIASHAARTFDFGQFEEWDVPLVGHRAQVLGTGPRGERYSPVDDTMTIRVDPPGITKTVRYARSQEGDSHTRCQVWSGAVVPIHNHLPIEAHGDTRYPSWLWTGSVIDELYNLSVELAQAFDWPLASAGNLYGTRPRSESAAWFILTDEAPQVRPIEARWETKHGGSIYPPPQWRMRLTIPLWLPEEEVLRALRLLRKQAPEGQKLPKTTRPLEVARFVWEQERLHGYREPPPWTAWFERWNELHRGNSFKSASNFLTYFERGADAVKKLNFHGPRFRERSQPSPNQPVLTESSGGFDVPIPEAAPE